MSKLGGRELAESMRQYDRLLNKFESSGGYRYESRIKEIAAGLGLDKKFYGVKVSELSGGQKSRLGLAKVLLTGADLLLLDEPTNHLDWDATLWLENFLKDSKAAVVIVSHDRFLLDNLVTKIIEINHRRATVFPGNYSNYRQEKEKRDLELQRQYQQRVEFVERTRDFIARNKDQEGMRKVARGRKTQLNKLLKRKPDFLEKPAHEKELSFEFAPAEQKSKRASVVLGCSNLAKIYDGLTLFERLDLEVLTGHRLGIIGPNGCGKTTLLKLALGEVEPSSGQITLKKNLSAGYLDQAGVQLNDDNTVLEEASTAATELLPGQLRNKLGAFLFSGDDVFRKVGQLSGGERNRLALCKLVLSAPEVLILDEPTNHLDIPSIEALENAIQNYSGTVIIVSHDRYFLDKTVDKLLVLGVDKLGHKKCGGYEQITGSVSQYMQLLEQRRLSQADAEKNADKKKPKRQDKQRRTTPQELIQFAMWSFEKLEKAVEETEEQITKLTERFGDSGIYKDPQDLANLQQQLDERKHSLELLYRAYERKLNT
jgi:ATP-binding cassette subfamily F protein 3